MLDIKTWALPSLILGLMLVGDALLYAILPTQAAAFGLSTWGVGLLLAANRLVRLVGMPTVVRATARHGGRWMMGGAVLLSVMSTVGYASLSGVAALLPTRLGWGLAYSAGNLTMLNAASLDASRVGSRVGMARALSKTPALVALLVAPFAVSAVGVRWVFAVAALVALLGLPLTRYLPESQAEANAPVFGWPTPRDRLLAAVSLAVDGVLVTCAGLLFGGADGVFAASAVLGSLRAADLLLAPLAGLLCDRTDARYVLLGAVTGIGLGVLLIGVGFMPAIALVVLCRPLVTPAVYAEARRDDLGSSLATIGRLATWRDVGAAIGPLFALAAVEGLGTAWVFTGLSALIFGMTGGWIVAGRRG